MIFNFVIQVMSEVFRSNRHMYEEELLERIVSPFLKPLDGETSIAVRLEGISVRRKKNSSTSLMASLRILFHRC